MASDTFNMFGIIDNPVGGLDFYGNPDLWSFDDMQPHFIDPLPVEDSADSLLTTANQPAPTPPKVQSLESTLILTGLIAFGVYWFVVRGK